MTHTHIDIIAVGSSKPDRRCGRIKGLLPYEMTQSLGAAKTLEQEEMEGEKTERGGGGGTCGVQVKAAR